MNGLTGEIVWTKEEPRESGYYWALFRFNSIPEIVFLDPYGGINTVGDDTYFPPSDIVCWSDRLQRPYTPDETQF